MTPTFAPQRIVAFKKKESNRRSPDNFNEVGLEFVLEKEMDIDELMELVGYRGSNRAGIYEIHTDEGMIKHLRGAKLDNRTPRKRANILFRTWDAMIAHDEVDADWEWNNEYSIQN